MTWERRRRQLDAALGERQLVWLGIRGTDAQSLLIFRQFKQSHSLTCPLNAISLARESCLETLSRRRVDLDEYLLYLDSRRTAALFTRGLFSAIRDPCFVVPYRPTSTFSALRFVHRGLVNYLGLFDETQAQFEHKPWVESELRAIGVRTLPWSYHSEADRKAVAQLLGTGPVVVRLTKSAGGSGIRLIRTKSELKGWPKPAPWDYFCTAPFLSPTIPLNVGACVFRDGSVSTHGASVQLIGIPGCTNRNLGYCGNDFGAIKPVQKARLDDLEALAVKTGKWLHSRGYLGAFGVDAVIYEDDVLLAEVNPRFQGSSALSAVLDRSMGRSDIFMDHMAAFLGMEREAEASVAAQVSEQQPLFHLAVHNTASRPVALSAFPDHPSSVELRSVPGPEVFVEPGGLLYRIVGKGPVTRDGFSLSDAESVFGGSSPNLPPSLQGGRPRR